MKVLNHQSRVPMQELGKCFEVRLYPVGRTRRMRVAVIDKSDDGAARVLFAAEVVPSAGDSLFFKD